MMSLAHTLARTFEEKNGKLDELRAIVDACPMATFITDEQGGCVYVNQAYQTLVGRNYQELLGDGWKQILHHKDLFEVTRYWDESVSNEDSYDQHYRIVLPTGRIIPVHCRAVRLPSGSYVGYVNATDGTNCRFACEAKQALEALRRDREFA
jgi:two-component system NtrC family sensor kinase